jgi:HD-like signal output (HDOD) protein
MTPISPSELKKAANELPPSPQVFGKLGKLLRHPHTALNDITDLVNTDPSLTARVLRLSNSAQYTSGFAIDNLDDAINRIGFREVFKLVGMAAVSDVFSAENATYAVPGSLLWENALCCGLAMETFAQKLGQDEQDAYTLGLLRSFGKLVINIRTVKCSDPVRYPITEEPNLLDWEEAQSGTSNPQVAGFLLSTWNFRAETIDAIQNQYTPEASTINYRNAAMLNLACSIGESLGKKLPGEEAYFKSAETHLDRLGLDAGHLVEAQAYAEEALDKALASVAA